MPDGGRPPLGAIVHTEGGDYQMTAKGGVIVPPKPATTAPPNPNAGAKAGIKATTPSANVFGDKKALYPGTTFKPYVNAMLPNTTTGATTSKASEPQLNELLSGIGTTTEILGEAGVQMARRNKGFLLENYSKMRKAGKGMGYVATALDVVEVGENAIVGIKKGESYNEIVNDASVDLLWIGASYGAAASAGATAGTAVCPVAGTIIGAAAGLAVDKIGDIKVEGITIKQHIKDMPPLTPDERPGARFSLN